MRPIWSGSINFGLINIPVSLFSGTTAHGLDLDLLHKKDHSHIRYARICSDEEKEVPWEDIVRGYKVGKEYVVLTPQDFKRVNARKTQMIEIETFVDQGDIDPIYYEKPYFLEPRKGAEKAYALLREALKESGKVGVATFVLRNRENPCVVKPMGDALIVIQLRFHSEVRDLSELNLPKLAAKGKEMKMALSLIGQMEDRFEPASYKDTYTAELKKVIDAKAKGKAPPRVHKTPKAARTTDLVALLEKSLRSTGKRTPALSKVRK